MMSKKYLRKPIVIEALQLTEDTIMDCLDFVFGKQERKEFDVYCDEREVKEDNGFMINTVDGTKKVNFGDYIIKGAEGDFYSCEKEIFEENYELIETEEEVLVEENVEV